MVSRTESRSVSARDTAESGVGSTDQRRREVLLLHESGAGVAQDVRGERAVVVSCILALLLVEDRDGTIDEARREVLSVDLLRDAGLASGAELAGAHGKVLGNGHRVVHVVHGRSSAGSRVEGSRRSLRVVDGLRGWLAVRGRHLRVESLGGLGREASVLGEMVRAGGIRSRGGASKRLLDVVVLVGDRWAGDEGLLLLLLVLLLQTELLLLLLGVVGGGGRLGLGDHGLYLSRLRIVDRVLLVLEDRLLLLLLLMQVLVVEKLL